VIQLRHQQPSLWEGLFAEEVAELWEPWMRVVDELLEDDELLDAVYQAQGKRHRRSRTRGRRQTPAEVALRMLILKHVRNWSYEIVEREVRANVVYRSFCRIGMAKVPDEKTLLRLGQAIGPETIRELHDRIVGLAQERGVIQGRKLRVDTTVIESNIHYPTDSGLLNDGARVLTRTMKQIEGKAGSLKKKVRDRMRSVTKRVIAIAHALRHKGLEGELKRKKEYRQLLRVTRQILNDARSVLQEVAALPTRRRRAVRQLGERLETMAGQVRRVVRQTKARVLDGLTQLPGKLVSLFEPHTEIIRKGKAGKPNEFGKLVQLQEAENQIITHYEVYEERPSDRHLLLRAVEAHRRKLGRTPQAGKAALVQARPEVADGMRRPDQRGQAAARVSTLSLSRSRWNEEMGRTRDHRRQPYQHGTLAGITASIRSRRRSSRISNPKLAAQHQGIAACTQIGFLGSAILHREVD